jgi:chaperonin GroEL (HSP60 family)
LVLRGGSDQFLDEADRSLHDAIMIVRRALKSPLVVPGGGAIDMELSKHLRWGGWGGGRGGAGLSLCCAVSMLFSAVIRLACLLPCLPARLATNCLPGCLALPASRTAACRDHARSIPGKAQLFINAFARALEVIPRQLADNSGFDATGAH